MGNKSTTLNRSLILHVLNPKDFRGLTCPQVPYLKGYFLLHLLAERLPGPTTNLFPLLREYTTTHRGKLVRSHYTNLNFWFTVFRR